MPHPDYPSYEMQDPFFTRINGELIIGGVRVINDPLYPENIVAWVTQFYRGKNIANLELFLMGPYHMKDLRLIELASGEIGVLTKPQGYKGGRGKIGFYKVRCLEEIQVKDIALAFNPDTLERTPMKVIASRSDFPAGAALEYETL
jgi:hypothetical protein